MAFQFKPQQQLAIEYPGNVAVSAGAGSGKTRVLVEKYFRLLIDEHPDWPIDSVVAITFTVKAAGELRERIIKRVREELILPELSEIRRARLQELRREISGAPIGTIHNFCSRTLREFAFDARLNPDFTIVEGAQESSLRRDAVQQALAEQMSAPGTQGYTDLLAVTNVYSRRQLAGMLETMLGRRAEFGPPCRRYAELDEEQIVQELTALCAENAGTSKGEIVSQLEHCIEKFCGGANAAAEELLRPFAMRLTDWKQSGGAWTELVQVASELQGALFTAGGTLRKALEKSLGVSGESECVQCLLEACTACALAASMELGDDDRDSVRLAAMIARLYLHAEEIYGSSRSAANSPDEVDLLDFTDLELMSERLITSSTSVRRRMRERVKYLIVDEFQDTSEVQWRILGPIVCADDGPMLPRRFFMVGDVKQGVYGFRQASSRLFAHVRQLVMDSNPEDECRGNISITYNFRTLETPLRAVNALFEQLMADATAEHEVQFESLDVQRSEAAGGAYLIVAKKPARGEQLSEDEPCEADLVIAEIERLRQQAQCGPIAILVRKRKHFEPYELALRSRGIRYITHRGKGLYEQPEVLDIIALLRLVANPHDDICAAEVTRGPLFSFCDDLLLKVSLAEASGFFAKCCTLASAQRLRVEGEWLELTGEEVERLRQVTEVVAELKALVGLVDIDVLVRRLLELTGALAIFAAGRRGEQALANINRLLELARSLNTADLDEFLAYVESESFDGRGQGEAVVHSDDDAVQIMTIHAAKGLEFHTVFLPELADPITVRREDVLTDGERWLALQKTLSGEAPQLFLSTYLGNQKKLRAMSEEKRVLYVAMTRCRDVLYLSASEGGTRQQDSFYGWMQPHLPNLPVERHQVEVEPTGTEAVPHEIATGKTTLHDGVFESTHANCRRRLGLDKLSVSSAGKQSAPNGSPGLFTPTVLPVSSSSTSPVPESSAAGSK